MHKYRLVYSQTLVARSHCAATRPLVRAQRKTVDRNFMVMVLVVVMVVLLVVIGNPLGKAHQLWHGRTLSFKRQEKKQPSNENHPYFFIPLTSVSCIVSCRIRRIGVRASESRVTFPMGTDIYRNDHSPSWFSSPSPGCTTLIHSHSGVSYTRRFQFSLIYPVPGYLACDVAYLVM